MLIISVIIKKAIFNTVVSVCNGHPHLLAGHICLIWFVVTQNQALTAF